MLQWQFLGTSAGVPTKQRNVSALALGQSRSKSWLLIDCGEGTQQQLLRTHWSMKHLSAICITHVHGDHCYGLPGVIASASLHKRTEPLTIVAPLPLWQWLQQTILLTDMHLSFELQFVDVKSLQQQMLHIDGFEIDTHVLNHRVPSHAYRVRHTHTQRRLNTDKLKLDGIPANQMWGLLQQGQNVTHLQQMLCADDYTFTDSQSVCVVVAGDNDTPSLLQDACRGAQVLIHEATYTQDIADKVGAFPMHSSAKQVAQFAQGLQLPHLMLTHFSARYATPKSLLPLQEEAQSHYAGQLYLAEDFATYVLHSDGEIQAIPLNPARPS